ncbi:Hypothetical protein SMAX5B_015331 [Scophthalmus maximus]|uniref:Uncharacterized protein n=1 Tax=Scophthalmus maximus TaxID=52904 RepID=A0A2U9C7N1_SCOMX|nr:Hypothetical protein SMAX5B_015331 [Scophthalmus maximus]
MMKPRGTEEGETDGGTERREILRRPRQDSSGERRDGQLSAIHHCGPARAGATLSRLTKGTQKAQRFVNEAEPGEAEQIEATKKKNLHRQQRQAVDNGPPQYVKYALPTKAKESL